MAISENQVVSIGYEVKATDNDQVVDSNIDGKPLTFIVGKEQVILALEDHVKTMKLGDSSNVVISAKDAYGEYDEKAIQILPKEQFAGIELIKGMPLYGQGEDGGTVQVAVKSFTDDKVTIDFNHPLAGKELAFAVSVSMVRDASADELSSGIPAENAQPEDESCGTGCGCH
jgi:FKBP-type peptidyl-prolyl cis-trans isomerase SlyD